MSVDLAGSESGGGSGSALADVHESRSTATIDTGNSGGSGGGASGADQAASFADAFDYGDPSDDEYADPGADDAGSGEGGGTGQARDESGRFTKTGDGKPPPAAAKTGHGKPPPAAAATAATGGVNADLIAEAVRLHGLSEDQAKAFGSDAALRGALALLDRQAATWGKQHLAGGQTRQPGSPPPPAEDQGATETKAPPPAAAAKAAQQAENLADAMQAAFEKFKVELDPNEFDETTIKLINGLNDHYDAALRRVLGENDKLKASFSAISDHFASQERNRFFEEMDRFFDGLGDEWTETFGKGTANNLAPDSAELKNRREVLHTINALSAADEQSGRKSTLEELKRRAVRAAFGDKTELIARNQVAAEVEKRRGLAISRPTAKTSHIQDPRQRAIKHVNDFMRDRGISDDDIPDEL